MSALAELAGLRATVTEAERRVGVAVAAGRAAEAAPARIEAEMRRYHEDVGAGRRTPDPQLAAQLQADLTAANAGMTTRTIHGGATIAVNAASEATITGARRALEDAQRAVARFTRARSEDLAAELAANARDLAARYAPLAEQVAEMEREWAAVRRAWAPVVEALRIPAEMAESPARRARFGDPPMPPMPLALLNEDEVPVPMRQAWKAATSPTAVGS